MKPTQPHSVCARCETLPTKIEGTGRLYLWFPSGHSMTKVLYYLRKAELDYELKEDGQCLAIELEEIQTETCVNTLAGILTQNELKNTRALFMADTKAPELRDCARTTSLARLTRLNQSGWLLDLLAADRVTCQFQPIVSAQDTSDIFGHEALLRGIAPNGSFIPPGPMFSSATEAGILVQLDLIARRTAIRETKRHQIKEHIFINFSPTSIYDPTSCLRSTMQAIDEAGISHEQIVFEVVESHQPQDTEHLKGILNIYREAGFCMALDDFGAGGSNLNLLHQLRPDFIKLDMSLIRNVQADSYKAFVTEKILELASHLNIQTIAEGIESPEELDWVRQRGATFVQGYLISQPTTFPLIAPPQITTSSPAVG
ncbi:EAL domain-containing protein [Planktothrix sp. FACHB-1355]|uniref:EAL domain-containing protein n=2 Tax=Cyanophyceae TaxID=3028117 RepID=A0A926VFJ9_9CYAN|nr:EAL domain-containing protein [Aerosakkonema funiforme FACHB-1375]MBD3558023.1 EAL domain-containing protein [Planktothrix sp. FACHB-1355]